MPRIMQIVLIDNEDNRRQLLPITYTRPAADICVGLYTLEERWKEYLPGDYSHMTAEYLRELYPAPASVDDMTLYVAGNVVADEAIAAAASSLRPGQRLVTDGLVIASRGDDASCDIAYAGEVLALRHVYDIFTLNDRIIKLDFAKATAGRESRSLSATNTVIGDPTLIFVEEGAFVECSSLNTLGGPIYIGKDATVMEGCHLRGPIAMLEHSQANMGCLIYGATTLGPYCKVGGELNNVVMLGYSNKGHDGFLGNSVVGQWCNLGGGTIASNLKNDYSEIKLWNYPASRFLRTGLQFCGLIMGDHSKSAINTTFNTATTVGVGCNIISEGMPRVFIPSFSKGGTAGFDNVNMAEFFAIARRVMARRNKELTPAHQRMYEAIADYSDSFK